MSEQAGKIGLAIVGILRDVGAIGKNKRNDQQRFMFRGIDDVYNAIHPLLAKHGVYITTEVLDEIRQVRETKQGNALYWVRLNVRFKIHCAEDGSFRESVVPGEAMDSADKGTNKALSIAYKYALFQLLCIPTEETATDPDATTNDDTVPKTDGEPDPSQDSKKPSGKPKFDEVLAQEALDSAKTAISRSFLRNAKDSKFATIGEMVARCRERLSDGTWKRTHHDQAIEVAVTRLVDLANEAIETCQDMKSLLELHVDFTGMLTFLTEKEKVKIEQAFYVAMQEMKKAQPAA